MPCPEPHHLFYGSILGHIETISCPARPDRSKPFQNLPLHQTFLADGNVEDTANQVAQFIKGRYKKIQRKNAGDRYYFLGEKGNYSRFGVYLVHLSVLIILIGGLIGSFFGL